MEIPQNTQETINRATWAAAGIGSGGSLAPLDIAGMSRVWIDLVWAISQTSGQSIHPSDAERLILSLPASVPFYGGDAQLANVLLSLTGASSLPAIAVHATFNWIYTHRLGWILALHFHHPQFTAQTAWPSIASQATHIVAVPDIHEATIAYHTLCIALRMAQAAAVPQHAAPRTLRFGNGQPIPIAPTQTYDPEATLRALHARGYIDDVQYQRGMMALAQGDQATLNAILAQVPRALRARSPTFSGLRPRWH